MREHLDDYSAAFAAELFRVFPWMKDHVRRVRPGQAHTASLELEYAPCPDREGCLFWISTTGGEVTVGFGMFHTHFDWPRFEGDDHWENPLTFIDDLIAERLLVEDRTQDGKWSGSRVIRFNEEPDLSGAPKDCVVTIRSWTGQHDHTITVAAKNSQQA